MNNKEQSLSPRKKPSLFRKWFGKAGAKDGDGQVEKEEKERGQKVEKEGPGRGQPRNR